MAEPDTRLGASGPLYSAGVPAHGLPIFGRWLFEDPHRIANLSDSPDTAEFARMSRAVLAAEGQDTARVGAQTDN